MCIDAASHFVHTTAKGLEFGASLDLHVTTLTVTPILTLTLQLYSNPNHADPNPKP